MRMERKRRARDGCTVEGGGLKNEGREGEAVGFMRGNLCVSERREEGKRRKKREKGKKSEKKGKRRKEDE